MKIKIKISNKLVPSWVIFNIDLLINVFSIITAFFLRFNFKLPDEFASKLFITVFIVVAVKSILFLIAKPHTNIIRYTSIGDLVKLIFIVLISSTVLIVGNLLYFFIIDQHFFIPLSILIIDFLTSAYLMVFTRMLVKIAFVEIRSNTANRANTIILGTEELAVSVKRAIDLDPEANNKIVAFIDNTKDISKKKLEGLDIYNSKRLESLIRKYSVRSLIIAKTDITPSLKSLIVEKCLNMNVKVMSVQNVKSWIKGEIDVKRIKNIRIEDLLERETINLDFTQIKKQIQDKTVLVTGSGGSIGSEIVRQICQFKPYKIILLDQAETPLHNIEIELAANTNDCRIEILLADITNELHLNRLFNTHKIDIVYHAAAYKHVPMMERHPYEAIKNNVFGTKILADFAVKYKVQKFVMISTDKAVNPTNVMGASKRIAEIYTQSLNEMGSTSFITTRFGNVLGSNGSVIPLFKKQIENGGPVTVTDPEVSRFFMTIPEACQLVLEASAMGKGGEIFIFDMGKSIRISDLAVNMIKLAGLTPGKDIEIKYVGLRPGEKLYEELLAKEENTIPTYHPKIMIAKVKIYNYEEISAKIDHLIEASSSQENMQLVSLMKEIVPEYKSHNSVYKILDSDRKVRNFYQLK